MSTTDFNCNDPQLDLFWSFPFTSGSLAGVGVFGGNTGADLKLHSFAVAGSFPGGSVPAGSSFTGLVAHDLKSYWLGSGPNGLCGEAGSTGTFGSGYLAFLKIVNWLIDFPLNINKFQAPLPTKDNFAQCNIVIMSCGPVHIILNYSYVNMVHPGH